MTTGWLSAAFSRPVETTVRVMLRRRPERFFARYEQLCQERGLDELLLIVSFDCDRPEDAEAALRLHDQMTDLEIQPAYAVPGTTLRASAAIYRELATRGGYFLNHGSLPHTERVGNRYRSATFYDKLSNDEVAADVRKGHSDVAEVIGSEPSGFRTPHFGTYQRVGQLRRLHQLLAGLGYSYSSSTMPRYAYKKGPWFPSNGLVEFPVSGRATSPAEVIDSWSLLSRDVPTLAPNVYLDEARALGNRLRAVSRGIINVYADPSHVDGVGEFLEAAAFWRSIGRPTTFRDLLEVAL